MNVASESYACLDIDSAQKVVQSGGERRFSASAWAELNRCSLRSWSRSEKGWRVTSPWSAGKRRRVTARRVRLTKAGSRPVL